MTSSANNVNDRIRNDLPTTSCACEHPACQACRDRRVAIRAAAAAEQVEIARRIASGEHDWDRDDS